MLSPSPPGKCSFLLPRTGALVFMFCLFVYLFFSASAGPLWPWLRITHTPERHLLGCQPSLTPPHLALPGVPGLVSPSCSASSFIWGSNSTPFPKPAAVSWLSSWGWPHRQKAGHESAAAGWSPQCYFPGASVVGQHGKPLPGMPASRIGALADVLALLVVWEGSSRWPKCLGFCHSGGRPRWKSRPLYFHKIYLFRKNSGGRERASELPSPGSLLS